MAYVHFALICCSLLMHLADQIIHCAHTQRSTVKIFVAAWSAAFTVLITKFIESNVDLIAPEAQTFVYLILIPLLAKIIWQYWNNFWVSVMLGTHADIGRSIELQKIRIIFLMQEHQRIFDDHSINFYYISMLRAHLDGCKSAQCFCRGRAASISKGSDDLPQNNNIYANFTFVQLYI